MKIHKAKIKKAVKEVLNELKWPIYITQDDNGLEECEYIEFVQEVLAKIKN